MNTAVNTADQTATDGTAVQLFMQKCHAEKYSRVEPPYLRPVKYFLRRLKLELQDFEKTTLAAETLSALVCWMHRSSPKTLLPASSNPSSALLPSLPPAHPAAAPHHTSQRRPLPA